MEAEQQQLRNLRDFLLVYNKMTELCFSRCAKNLNYRSLTMDEEQCLDSCASKLIRSNHRLMAAYVGLMPGMVQRKMADLESAQGNSAHIQTSSEEAAGALPINSTADTAPSEDTTPEGLISV